LSLDKIEPDGIDGNTRPVIASAGFNPEAKKEDWIVSSQELLAMTWRCGHQGNDAGAV
jgi:hypothetical protein